MSSIIINTSKVAQNATTAYTRNALILSKELNIPLISTYQEAERLNAKDFDKFIISGSAFYPETARIERWIRNHANPVIIWLNNEYSTTPNSEYYRLMKDFYSVVVSNVSADSVKCKGYDDFHLLNLNVLFYSGQNSVLHKKYNCIYYGTYRPGRRIYFQRYFQGDYIHVSSSSKNIKQFSQLGGCDAIWCDKLNWESRKESLNLFKYSLYIEDEYTHEHYNHLANRFYECLNCNVVQLFDKNCVTTLKKSGYNCSLAEFVSDSSDLEFFTKSDFEKLHKRQSAWNIPARIERQDVINKLSKILL